MKHPVFRKMSHVAILGSLVKPTLTILPIPVRPSFPVANNHSQSTPKLEVVHAFHKCDHRTQSKVGNQKANPASTTFNYQAPIRTTDDIIFANRVICTWNLLTRATTRRLHIFDLITQEAIVHDCLEDFYDVMSDEEFNKLTALEKKIKRQCKDAIESYYQFVLSNMEVFAFGRLVPQIDVPSDKILFTRELASAESQDKHRSSRNQKEKFSRYKRRARKNKALERDFFMQEWTDDSEDAEVITLADVESNAKESERSQEMSPVEKAYHDFVTAPCVEEAAWAIYHGTEYEHAQDIAEAYQLLSNYQKVASSEN